MNCHLCTSPLDDDTVFWAGGLSWCRDLIACKFRARRRLGVPLTFCYRAQKRDRLDWAQEKAEEDDERAEWAASLPRAPRDVAYVAYLASEQWGAFADRQKIDALHRCERCRRTAVYDLTVHHAHYRTLGVERPDDVLVVCPICHRELDELRRQKRHPAFTVQVEPGPPPRRIVTWADEGAV